MKNEREFDFNKFIREFNIVRFRKSIEKSAREHVSKTNKQKASAQRSPTITR